MEQFALFPPVVDGLCLMMRRDRWGGWSIAVSAHLDGGPKEWVRLDEAIDLPRDVAWFAASESAHRALFGPAEAEHDF